MTVKIKEPFPDSRREDSGLWMKEMKITEIATHLSSSSASYLSMGFISETNFYLKKMSCMQNWFIQREKTMYILLTSWLRFHIKKKKKFLYLFQMMHSIYHKQFSDAWKNLKLFPK